MRRMKVVQFSHPLFFSRLCRSAEDDEGRPLKRIKLEESELAKEADVVTLQKPPLGF